MMRGLAPHVLCLLAWLSAPGSYLEAADEESARLKARVEQLEAENKALHAEIVRLRDELYKVPGGKSDEARLATDMRRLAEIDKALQKEPNDPKVREEAAELARRLAPLQPGKMVW
jgi:predicted RNase H-like nuclease (RuvC/YqgF family)